MLHGHGDLVVHASVCAASSPALMERMEKFCGFCFFLQEASFSKLSNSDSYKISVSEFFFFLTSGNTVWSATEFPVNEHSEGKRGKKSSISFFYIIKKNDL